MRLHRRQRADLAPGGFVVPGRTRKQQTIREGVDQPPLDLEHQGPEPFDP